MRRASAVLAIASLAALGLAACGGGSNNDTTAPSTPAQTTATTGGGATGGATTLDVSTPSGSTLAFNQKSLSAKSGSVTIDFDNMQPLQHDVEVEDSSGQIRVEADLVSSITATTTVQLQPGSYTFFCTVPGHLEA